MEAANSSTHADSIFKIPFRSCPVSESMGILGKKWTLIVLRNIGVYRIHRFNEMLRFTPGLNRRTLSLRLSELRKDGIIEVVEKGTNYSRWDLTEKGKDVLPIIMSILSFGIRWQADKVFADGKPRSLPDVFEMGYIISVLDSMKR